MTGSGAHASLDVEALRSVVNAGLEQALAAEEGPQRLLEAMRYSALAPGKRVRGILCLLTASDLGQGERAAEAAGVAVELVHASSLVLDDLPSMDDARLRRGRPTAHLVFGQDAAILSAISLMNLGFRVLGDVEDAAIARAMSRMLTQAIGPDGLTGGQWSDLNELDGCTRVSEVSAVHGRKTGALFAAATGLGGLAAGSGADAAKLLWRFGNEIGLAFQTYDDLLDARAQPDVIGKDVGRDAGKATLVSLLGMEEAERRARGHLTEARAMLAAAGLKNGRLSRYVEGLVRALAEPERVAVDGASGKA